MSQISGPHPKSLDDLLILYVIQRIQNPVERHHVTVTEPTAYLEAVGSIRGVLGRFPRVELGVAAEEDSLQFAVDGRTVTPTAIF